MPTFKKASWIWKENPRAGEYIRIEKKLPKGSYRLRAACESVFAVYVGGKMIFSWGYDAPYGNAGADEFFFDLEKEETTLKLVARYVGVSSSVYRAGKAGLLYEIEREGKILFFSQAGEPLIVCKGIVTEEWAITPQLGRAVSYDFTALENTVPAVPADRKDEILFRPFPRCVFREESPKITTQGSFTLTKGNTPAEKIENTRLEESAQTGKFPLELLPNRFFIADLGRESAGYLTFDIFAEEETEILVGYGEHLADGRPRCRIDTRNFAFSCRLKRGGNVFTQPFWRLGCRYIVCLSLGKIRVNKFSFVHSEYPVKEKKTEISDARTRAIYETAVRTSRLCMHDHVEDCPWREQALYAMDARNQALYNYYIFGETEFSRANFELFLSTQREDGLFDLCAPSEISVTIPVFSLFLLLAACEYYEFTGDSAFLEKHRGRIERCFSAFLEEKESGLVPRFKDTRYWNFYEWTEGLDGGEIFRSKEQDPVLDLPLNAVLVIVLKKAARAYEKLGWKNEFQRRSDTLYTALLKNFYDEAEQAFYSFSYAGKKWGKHGLSQMLMLAAGETHREELLRNILTDRFPRVTVGFLSIEYDAVLERDIKLKNWVRKDMERIFGGMLEKGATSFFETEKGEADFNGAGSLCHAWAAVPAYIYRKYFMDESK